LQVFFFSMKFSFYKTFFEVFDSVSLSLSLSVSLYLETLHFYRFTGKDKSLSVESRVLWVDDSEHSHFANLDEDIKRMECNGGGAVSFRDARAAFERLDDRYSIVHRLRFSFVSATTLCSGFLRSANFNVKRDDRREYQ